MTFVLHGHGISLSRGGRLLLEDAGLELRSDEVLGIIGPNGAGKSMLLRVLAGFEGALRGEVVLLDRPLHGWTGPERAARLAYLPQHFNPHWDLRVQDLVRLGLDRAKSGRTIQAVLSEHDLEALAADRWSTLSGGERARSLLAAVIANDPPVLLADEPTAALDVAQASTLMRRLRARAGATAIVLHDLHLAASWCDRLILMHAGRVRAVGTAETVLLSPALDEVFGIRFERLRDASGLLLLSPAR